MPRGVLMAIVVEPCIVIGRLRLPCAEFVLIPLAMLYEAPFADAKRLWIEIGRRSEGVSLATTPYNLVRRSFGLSLTYLVANFV